MVQWDERSRTGMWGWIWRLPGVDYRTVKQHIRGFRRQRPMAQSLMDTGGR